MFTRHGAIFVSLPIVLSCDKIKHDNQKVNTIQELQKTVPQKGTVDNFLKTLADKTGQDHNKLDMVYFACPKGCDIHVNKLDSEKYTNTSFLIPIMLPGKEREAIFIYGKDYHKVHEEKVYQFDHSVPHGLVVSNFIDGCAVIMVAVKR